MRDNTLPHPGKPVWTEPQNLSVCGQGQRCAPGEDCVKLLDLKREGGALEPGNVSGFQRLEEWKWILLRAPQRNAAS